MKWKRHNLTTANISFTGQVFKNYGSLETQTAETAQKSYWSHTKVSCHGVDYHDISVTACL